MEEILKEIIQKTDSKIILLVMDGVGGLEVNWKTELETAKTPNLDELSKKSACGLTIPVLPGITPGSGPAHLALFGYDPLKYQIKRGILEACGLDIKMEKGDVAVRGNFATLKDGKIVDRRAGRIPSEECRKLCEKINSELKPISGVQLILYPGEEHRFVLIMRGEHLSDEIEDADPQKEGLPPKKAQPLSESAKFSADVVNSFTVRVNEILKDSQPANTVLLRGFSKYPSIPSMRDRYLLNPVAIAHYPMYKGLARIVGMDVVDVGASLNELVDAIRLNYQKYDFFYAHVKKTDSYGEDGNFENKVKMIEDVDSIIPHILSLNPDVLVITSDHSTPSLLKAHSWHPNPFLLYSRWERRGDAERFTEKECRKGSLGLFYARDAMLLILANSLKLKKFGA
ncbi:MAG: 2,3-bisphosphoglycerate-independent phosphoglycerate mutase [Candidatus Aminicenantia bacterium]